MSPAALWRPTARELRYHARLHLMRAAGARLAGQRGAAARHLDAAAACVRRLAARAA